MVTWVEAQQVLKLQDRSHAENVRRHRQDPYFHYLFGVEEPGCFALLDVRTARCMLFFPRLSEDHAVWMGATPTLEEYRFKYGVQETYWVDQISDVLMELLPPCLHLLKGVNPDRLAIERVGWRLGILSSTHYRRCSPH